MPRAEDLSVSSEMREKIKGYEGLRLTSYRDVGGRWTIGWGHTGMDVGPNMTVTENVANVLFSIDIARISSGVRREIGKTPVTQNQFDALVSFAFNEGLHALQVSTLMKKFRLGDNQGAAAEFTRWVYTKGDVYEGLVKRRQAERDLFLSLDNLKGA